MNDSVFGNKSRDSGLRDNRPQNNHDSRPSNRFGVSLPTNKHSGKLILLSVLCGFAILVVNDRLGQALLSAIAIILLLSGIEHKNKEEVLLISLCVLVVFLGWFVSVHIVLYVFATTALLAIIDKIVERHAKLVSTLVLVSCLVNLALLYAMAFGLL